MSRYAVENLFDIEGLNIAWYGIIIEEHCWESRLPDAAQNAMG